MSSYLKMVLEGRDRRIAIGLCLFLVIGITVVYGQTLGFGFVDYDDPGYVYEHPKVPEGLTWDGIKWAFTAMHGSNWFPLVWLSLMVDRQLFGAGAGGFHLVNVALHIANTVLLFLVLRRYSGALWSSFFVAAFFGLHPLHVESVAWVTERKDVLSTLFWMLTMLAYVRYVGRPTVKRYVTISVIYALGLMTKPMLVTLPFVLLVMDYWPLQRLWPAGTRQQDGSEVAAGEPVSRLILEKAPFFVLSALSSVMTFVAQKSGGAVVRFSVISFNERLGNALVSYCDYILKMFRPVGLAVFYPHPKEMIAGWKVAVSMAALLVVTVVVILLRRRRYLLAGWLWYLGTLVPVIGLVQVGSQAMADRYTYIPLTGVFIMLVWLAGDIIGRWRHRTALVGLAGSVLLSVLGVLTFRQVGYWRDTVTLFTHAVAVTTDNYVAHSILGVWFAEKGNLKAAMREFETVLRMMPKDADTLYNVAKGLALQGRTNEAIECYKQVLAIVPGDADTYSALASIQAEQEQFENAIGLYREGLGHNPQNGGLHGGLGSLLLRMGQVDEAIRELRTAVKLKSDPKTYCNLGVAVSSKGQLDEAATYYKKSIQLNPKNAEAHFNLGNVYLSQSRLSEAVAEYEQAIDANPGYVKAHSNLAVALAKLGRMDEATANFRQVAELDPNSPEAHFNLANTLADKGLIAEAIQHLGTVVQLAPQDADARCMLADLLVRQRKVEHALAEYEEVLKTNPTHQRARLGLQNALAIKAEPNKTQ